LEKSINPKDIVPRMTLYAMFSALKKEYVGTGVTMLFWMDGSHLMHRMGFRTLYTRASSVKTMKNLIRYGGEAIAFTQGVENGQQMKFWFMRWSFYPIFYTNHFVEKFKERARL
jgi:hypothetical protein